MSEPSDALVAASDDAGAAARTREREIVRSAIFAVRAGRTETYARIVELYQIRLFNLVLMGLRDRAAAEDIVQEAFVRAYTHLNAYDAQRDFYPWLATIAVRLAQNWRRRIREHATEAPDEQEEIQLERDVLHDVIVDESSRRLWLAVAALPPTERMAMIMYYRQEMKIEEIARALGVTDGTIKTSLFRARAKLRSSMQNEFTPTSELPHEL